jgi:hypothetical protein
MTGPETLLARWSRRKSGARTSEGDADNAPDDSEARATRASATQPGYVPPPFDPASLPTLDSIGAKTDLRAFLDKGVPSELTIAALRRGWSADPVIRDFIGLSENSWDFNAAGGIPGFGTLEAGDIQRLLAQLNEGNATNEGVAPASVVAMRSDLATPQPSECDAGSEHPQDMSDNEDSVSEQNALQDPGPAKLVAADGVDAATLKTPPSQDRDPRTPSRRHGHGGALPRFDAI